MAVADTDETNRRGLYESLVRAGQTHPLVVLEGIAGVGKTALANQLRETGLYEAYVSLAEDDNAARARSQSTEFVADLGERPTIIDDIHLAPELLVDLQRAVERGRVAPAFLAVGRPLPRVGELARGGRLARLRLGSLAQSERRGTVGRFVTAVFAGDPSTWTFDPLALADYLGLAIAGGMPAVATDADVPGQGPRGDGIGDAAAVYEALARTLLGGEDAVRTNATAGQDHLRRMLDYLAARPGGRLRLERSADNLGLSPATLARQLDELVRRGAIVRLHPWSRTRRAALLDSMRVFVADPGLCAHALGIRALGDIDAASAPILLDALVAHELTTQNGWLRHPVDITFWRSRSGQFHVDFLLETESGAVIPVAVTTAAMPTAADLAGIDAFRRRHPRAFRRGVLLYPGDRVRALGDDRWAVPLSVMWTLAPDEAPLDVGSLDAELDAVSATLRGLVERATPSDEEAQRRREVLQAAMRAALEPRLSRIATTLGGLGMVIEPLDVTVVGGERGLPGWLAPLGDRLRGQDASRAAATVVGGLSIGVGQPVDGGSWLAVVVAELRIDGTVTWHACHALRGGDGAGGPRTGEELELVAPVGPLLTRFDGAIDGPVDQLSAALASTLPDAMAQLAGGAEVAQVGQVAEAAEAAGGAGAPNTAASDANVGEAARAA